SRPFDTSQNSRVRGGCDRYELVLSFAEPPTQGHERLNVRSARHLRRSFAIIKPFSIMSRTWPASCNGRLMDSAELQHKLAEFNHTRLRPALPEEFDPRHESRRALHHKLELSYLEAERARVRKRAAGAPRESRAFVRWFEDLKETGPGQNDRLFPWLARHASLEEMSWFLSQEVAGEAGFDDLVALAQLQLPSRSKLEMARNYWDEMGRGNAGGMHGPMLGYLASAMRLPDLPAECEPLALSNL